MTARRILIVEADGGFALSLASLYRAEGHATELAASAAEAERDAVARPPDLAVVRAELPDLSGFSLCARLRRERPGLPVVIVSSESGPEALAEHARTAGAANAYLAMPLDTAALVRVSRTLLAAAPVEVADDAVVEAAPTVEVHPGAPAPPPAAPTPPPVPRRARRTEITDADRLFLERAFRSVADRRDALVEESHRRRPPPMPRQFATPEGRMQLLREDLKTREAQIARLSKIWEVREQELAAFDERLHDKEVEIQALKLQVDELLRKLAEARDLFLVKEREHGASVEGMLLERFSQEKDLIEVVAGKERRIAELEREARQREADLARRGEALDAAAAEIGRLEGEIVLERERAASGERDHAAALAAREREHAAALAAREREHAGALGAREAELGAALRDVAEARVRAGAAERERDTRVEGMAATLSAVEAELAAAREREAAALAEAREARAAAPSPGTTSPEQAPASEPPPPPPGGPGEV